MSTLQAPKGRSAPASRLAYARQHAEQAGRKRHEQNAVHHPPSRSPGSAVRRRRAASWMRCRQRWPPAAPDALVFMVPTRAGRPWVRSRDRPTRGPVAVVLRLVSR
ncbi:MAG TPA: hypothetical protein VF933_17135 [Streptosporangiaceae bacterium]